MAGAASQQGSALPDGSPSRPTPLRRLDVRRYVTPLREGGSLPAIVEADDDGLYVLKFRGSGQGPASLVAELLAGEIARRLGLRVPELVLMTLDPALAMTEPDPEIQSLIRGSAGLNLALDYLPGAMTFDPIAWPPDPALASRIVWFDALVSNVDRTARNVNLLLWHREVWLIDHGAALYVHHDWSSAGARSRDPFARIRDHVLLPHASGLAAVDAELSSQLTPAFLGELVAAVPGEWLADAGGEARRADYLRYFVERLATPCEFVEEAIGARARLL